MRPARQRRRPLAAVAGPAVRGLAVAGLAVAGLAAVPGTPGDAATYTVCALGCPYTQIQPAVDAAPAGGTVRVGPGSFAGGIVIAKALTLSGAGAGATVIDGGGPVVSVSGGPVIIEGVTVTGGNTPGDGAGILSTGTLTVQNSAIRHNTAGGDGGGIASDAGSILITGSSVSRNTAAFEGGGIAGTGPLSKGVTLLADTVTANSAGDSGGGIAAVNRVRATLSGTAVDANTAASCGGGVDVEGAALVMIRGQVDHNQAQDCGGGIEIGGFRYGPAGSGTITETSIDSNAAGTGGGLDIGGRTSLIMTADAVSTNTATMAGGGINVYSGLKLNDTSVSRNTSGGDGGGISNVGGDPLLTGDRVDANTAAGEGGGLFNGFLLVRNHRVAGKMTLNPDTSVNSNRAAAGGGIAVVAGSVRLNGATVARNIPDNCQPAGC